MSNLSTIDDFLGAMMRHIVLLAFVVTLGVAASLFYALSLPRSYETTAVIQIEQPEIQQDGSGNGQTLQQLQIIEQRVMARGNILGIVEKYGLFSDVQGMTENEKVNLFRESARVSQVSDPAVAWRPDITPTALNVTVALEDPDIAAVVANELVDNVLDENRERRARRARETMAFFESEEGRVGEAIVALEAEVAAFKRSNAGNFGSGLEALRQELLTLRDAELTVTRELLEVNANQRGSSTLLATQTARLEEQRNLLRARINEIQAILANAPDIERALGVLERELRKFTDQYQVITRNQAEAEMRLMLEEAEQSESFIVLERAVAPDDPISPNRKRIVFLGCVISGLVGLALVAFLELRNPVVRTESQLEKATGLKAVTVIPNVEVAREKALRRALWIVGIATMVCLFIVLVALISAS